MKKGFTLVELLGVIVVLSIIIAIVFPGIVNVIKSTKEKNNQYSIDLIESAAKIYIKNHEDEINETDLTCITFRDLVSDGNVTIDDEDLLDTKSVLIPYNANSFDDYIVDSDDSRCATYVGCFIINSNIFHGTINGYNETTTKDGETYTCPKKVVIPNKIDGIPVTYIGRSSFSSIQFTSVILPNTLEGIGDYAFRSSQLKNVTIPNSVTSIGSYAFYSSELTSLTIPDSVTKIGMSAFFSSELTSLTIPDSVTSIGAQAFYSSELTSLTIPNSVTSIGASAFERSELTSLTIPDSVTYIGDGAFYSSPLTSLTFGNGVKDIGENAFYSSKLTSVELPSALREIGSNAFYNSKLTSVRIHKNKDESILGTDAFGWAPGYSNSNICWDDYCPQ